MTPKTFCASGTAESFKGAVHATAVVLVGAMAAYNLAAWSFRRQRHLAINATLYSLLALYEVKQVARHWRRHE